MRMDAICTTRNAIRFIESYNSNVLRFIESERGFCTEIANTKIQENETVILASFERIDREKTQIKTYGTGKFTTIQFVPENSPRSRSRTGCGVRETSELIAKQWGLLIYRLILHSHPSQSLNLHVAPL